MNIAQATIKEIRSGREPGRIDTRRYLGTLLLVTPAQAGAQGHRTNREALGSHFRGNDEKKAGL